MCNKELRLYRIMVRSLYQISYFAPNISYLLLAAHSMLFRSTRKKKKLKIA